MPWKELTVSEERFKFITEVQKNERSFKSICEEFCISRQTGYKWWQRYSDIRDPIALKDLSRVPHNIKNKVSYSMESEVCEIRRRYPHWGPEKLLAKLKREHPKRKKWPSISTVGRILKRNDLIKFKKRRVKTPPYTKPFGKVTACNQLWCIDFKGHFKLKDGTTVYPLTITDAYSRYLLCCEALRKPDAVSVGKAMEKIFKQCGLPEAIRSDNGAPFASKGVGGLTHLSVWWTKMGIRHERIDLGSPEQNGRHERMHRTLKQEACKPRSTTLHGQQCKFKKFMKEYNEERPHQALDNMVPSDLYSLSLKKYSSTVIEHGFPKFGVDYAYVNKNGFTEYNGYRIKVGLALANEIVDVYPSGRNKWCFAYGPVVLGEFDEKKSKETLIRPKTMKKSVNHVLS